MKQVRIGRAPPQRVPSHPPGLLHIVSVPTYVCVPPHTPTQHEAAACGDPNPPASR